MERDEAYNARDLAYHMDEEAYEAMMDDAWMDDDEDFDPRVDLDNGDPEEWDDGEFDRFQDDFDEADYVEDDLYAGWDNEIEQGRWDE